MKFILLLLALTVTTSAVANKKRGQPWPEQSVMVYNYSTNTVTHERNADQPRSMASITKVMTAMVVLDTLPNLNQKVKLKSSYMGRREYTVKEMLDLLLVRSDNNISEILAKNFLDNRASFIQAMNDKARKIGMTTAEFVDPSGLLAGNRASTRDIATMLIASASYPAIRDTTKATMDFESKTKKGAMTVSLLNTNYRILNEFNNIVVSKTGTTTAAGKCLAMVVEQQGHTYAIVILGEQNTVRRDTEARVLLHTYIE